METEQSEALFRIRHFPPVVHPRHARELLAAHSEELLAAWVGGYSITVAEHRQMLEDLLASLAWKEHGQAALIQGLYGTGKSHLLVLLHLLCALPEAWAPFLDAHPLFRRYALAMQGRRPLVVHFSLDEYAPQHPLERTLRHEVEKALAAAEIAPPAAWSAGLSRLDAWTALLDCCREQGYDRLILLIDEVSLFLAGKSPAQREGDAAFLQFLADLTGRHSVWLIGALQRNLSDTGALRTHSWRQVEDRFHRYALSPQEIGSLLRDKLIERLDPAAIRAVISTKIFPTCEALGIPYTAGDLLMHWPFHPAALDLLMAVANSFLSPHRSVVEILQQIESTGPPERLITPLDLFWLVREDLQRDERLAALWKAVGLLEHCTEATDPLPALLALLHLADRTATVGQLSRLLYNGTTAPGVDELSQALHFLRRRGAYLAVLRDSDPAQEVFSLAIGDEIGALAMARMQELRQEMSPDDPRIAEMILQSCHDPAWPFAAALAGTTVTVSWLGGRPVHVICAQSLTAEEITRHFEGLLAGNADGCLLLDWPGGAGNDAAMPALTGPFAATLLRWRPRPLTDEERELWMETACWLRAADFPETVPREKQLQRRCRERAMELLPAAEAVVRSAYLDGEWRNALGEQGTVAGGATMVDALAGLFAAGFARLFPLAAEISQTEVPSHAACQQLLQYFLLPGEARLAPQSLLGEYIERFAVPLGCVRFEGQTARVVPPRREIADALLEATLDGPIRCADALGVLRRSPLGLTTEQGRLALAAMLQSGMLRGFDAFIQPLASDQLAATFQDAMVFIGAQAVVDESYRPLLASLAETWQIALDSWPAACSQVERKLRAWLAGWAGQMSEVQAAQAEWSDLLQVLPWGWRATDNLLAMLTAMLADESPSLEHLLDGLQQAEIDDLHTIDAIAEAASWWRLRRPQLQMLFHSQLPEVLNTDVSFIHDQLAHGEESFAALTVIGERLDVMLTTFREEYRRWHEGVFGSATVAALRGVFDSAEFRAVKLLARLPLPLPESANRCLEALAQARTAYCPGAFDLLEGEGCCARCRLPLGSPSPMPDAATIRQSAAQALRAFGELLAQHPRMTEMRQQLPRAPEAIARCGEGLLNWRPDDGAELLLTLLDEHFLAWLNRDYHVVGVRRVQDMRQRLGGRDLTVSEVQASVREWLDPEQALTDDALLSFE